jgi:hypothetical protein
MGKAYVFCRLWSGFAADFPFHLFNDLPDDQILPKMRVAASREGSPDDQLYYRRHRLKAWLDYSSSEDLDFVKQHILVSAPTAKIAADIAAASEDHFRSDPEYPHFGSFGAETVSDSKKLQLDQEAGENRKAAESRRHPQHTMPVARFTQYALELLGRASLQDQHGAIVSSRQNEPIRGDEAAVAEPLSKPKQVVGCAGVIQKEHSADDLSVTPDNSSGAAHVRIDVQDAPDGFYSPVDIAKAMKADKAVDAIRKALKRLLDGNHLPDGAWMENSNPAKGQARILYRLQSVRPHLSRFESSAKG